MKIQTSTRRHGVALILVIVALVVFSTIIFSITAQALAARRFLDRRHYQQQSLWLARSGLELAVAHLLNDMKYKGETTTLIPLGQVQVTVTPAKEASDIFQIISESRFPTDALDPVVQSLSRRYRRVVDGSARRLEVVDAGLPSE